METEMNKTAFLFSGQGAQSPGMMKEIYENNKVARKVFETANELLGRDITKLCLYGPEEELNLTHNTQPCLLTAEIATFEVIKSLGIVPYAVAGFSLGEYAALVAAEVMNFEEAIKLIQLRADAMQEAVPIGEGAMAAINTSDKAIIEQLCSETEGYVVGANYNCPGQAVVSGEKNAIISICKLAKERGIKATRLLVSAPFHCKLMEPARKKLEEEFKNVSFSNAAFPIYMNVDAKPEDCAVSIREKLLQQTVSPVCWEDTIINMKRDGIEQYIEVGPGDTLSKFVDKTISNVKIESIENNEDILNVWGR